MPGFSRLESKCLASATPSVFKVRSLASRKTGNPVDSRCETQCFQSAKLSSSNPVDSRYETQCFPKGEIQSLRVANTTALHGAKASVLIGVKARLYKVGNPVSSRFQTQSLEKRVTLFIQGAKASVFRVRYSVFRTQLIQATKFIFFQRATSSVCGLLIPLPCTVRNPVFCMA